MAQLRYFSQYNGFLPQATGQVISFIRTPESFGLNGYVQYVPTKVPIGAYYLMGRDLPARIPANAGTPAGGSTDFSAWADGSSRKEMGRFNKALFQIKQFVVARRNKATELGWMTRDAADEGGAKLISYYASALAQQMMTERTNLVLNLLLTSSNWPTNHSQSVTSLNGNKGTWDVASDDPMSPNYNAIMQTINNAVKQIVLDTNGQVTEKDLVLVIDPPTAIKMRAAPELTNYIRENPVAYETVYGSKENWNRRWGLPPMIYGVKLIIEDAAVVDQMDNSTATEATGNRNFLMPRIASTPSALLVSRPGGLDGNFGAPSYSTVQIYHYDGLLKVEAYDDPEDELTRIHVSESIATVLPAGWAGMLITGVTN